MERRTRVQGVKAKKKTGEKEGIKMRGRKEGTKKWRDIDNRWE